MTSQDILNARKLTVTDMLKAGITMQDLYNAGEITTAYYYPSDSWEYFDGTYYYNRNGNRLRDLNEYDVYSEGYTPFGDE